MEDFIRVNCSRCHSEKVLVCKDKEFQLATHPAYQYVCFSCQHQPLQATAATAATIDTENRTNIITQF